MSVKNTVFKILGAEEKPQSQKVCHLARIFALAEEVFSNDRVAQNWLKRPNRALGGAIPFELLDTDAGTQQVEEVLKRIEYGVYV